MTDSIVITGFGVISAIGNDKAETLTALQSEKTGVQPLKYLHTSHKEFPVGEVKLSDEEMKEKLGISEEPTTRTSLMGMIAMREALEQAALLDGKDRTAVLVSGTTVGGIVEKFSRKLKRRRASEYSFSSGVTWRKSGAAYTRRTLSS